MNDGSFNPNEYGNQGQGNNGNQTASTTPPVQPEGQPAQGTYQGQPYYGQPYTPYQPPVQPAAQPAHGLALASLICAILGFVCCGLFTSIPAVICAVQARKQGNTEAITTVGLVMGIVGIVLSAISTIASFAMLPMYMEMMEEMLKESMGGMLFFLK